MSSAGPVAPVSPAPVSAAALRAEILGAAETELIAILGAVQDPEAAAPRRPSVAAAPANPVTQAVDTARTSAAGRQASLAPLLADLTQTLSIPGLPAPIKAAIGQVLALQLPADSPLSPQDVRQAIARSGLFLEADLAQPAAPAPLDLKAALLTLQQALPAAPPAQAEPETPSPAQPDAPPTQPAQQAQAPPQGPAPATPPDRATSTPLVSPQAASPQAAAASSSPAPAQALTTPAPSVAVEAPTGQVPPPPAPAEAPVAPPILPQAAVSPTAQSPAGAASPLPATLAAVAPLDPKAALLTLQQALPPAAGGDAPGEAAPDDLRAALLTLQQAAAEPAAAATPAPAQRTPPPVRDAALSPQAPAPTTLSARADLAAVVEHLRPQVEQALARVTLHQLASLPDGTSSAWMFEVPIATPQGAAVAQFEVERDGAGSSGADGATPWRARFSLDIEPLGPVHVHLAMAGGKAAVSVWAERADSLQWLRGQGAALAGALPADVVFRAGTPGGATPARGHFLDQTS